MPIVADLEDLTPAEFLMVLALNQKTGRLTAERDEDRVMIAFHEGSIVYAATNGPRETVGAMLVRRGLARPEEIEEALRQQRERPGVHHLGNILVEMGVVTRPDLEKVVSTQFQNVLRQLLAWSTGVASFERREIPDLGAVHFDPREVILEEGLSTEQMVLEGMSELEDAAHESGGIDDMQTMLAELQEMSLSLTAEMAGVLLDQASRTLDRVVLMLVHPRELAVVGAVGTAADGSPLAAAGRRLERDRRDGSLVSRAIETRRAVEGRLGAAPAELALAELLGRAPPGPSVAVPVSVGGRVLGVLYGDQGPAGGAVGDIGRLVDVVSQVAGGSG